MAVFGEEWGFVGCVALVTLLLPLSAGHLFNRRAGQGPVRQYAGGRGLLYFFWQITINMGMVIGLMPVVGHSPAVHELWRQRATMVNFSFAGHCAQCFNATFHVQGLIEELFLLGVGHGQG